MKKGEKGSLRDIYDNLIGFRPQPGVPYMNRYDLLLQKPEIKEGAEEWIRSRGRATYDNNAYLKMIRDLARSDPFFIVHIVAGNPVANDPKGFIVKMCAHALLDLKSFYSGDISMFLDVWSRDHFKSSIKSVAIPIIHALNNPNDAILINSATTKLAQGFLGAIKQILEMPEMIAAFSDILYDGNSPAWNAEQLLLKRKTKRKEKTFEIAAILEGTMNMSRHYGMIISDDIESWHLAQSPEQLKKLVSGFYMTLSLGSSAGTFLNVIGTFYSKAGILADLVKLKHKDNGEYAFNYRKVSVIDEQGEPVFFTKERLREVQLSPHYATQYLCDLDMETDSKLPPSKLVWVDPKDLPKGMYRIILIDPASGNIMRRDGDKWSVMSLGFKSRGDDIKAVDVYLYGLVTKTMTNKEALNEIVKAYINGGTVQAVCVEQIALDMHKHAIKEAIYDETGIDLIEGSSLISVRPKGSGISKLARIYNSLSWPLENRRIHVSKAIPRKYSDVLVEEMRDYPYIVHDDNLDNLHYYPQALEKLNYDPADFADYDKQEPYSPISFNNSNGSRFAHQGH
jgi:hypothetical protein